MLDLKPEVIVENWSAAQLLRAPVTDTTKSCPDTRHEYYEMVFKEMVADGSLSLEAVFFDPERWYEIDTLEDHKNAESMLDRIKACAESFGRDALTPAIVSGIPLLKGDPSLDPLS